MNLKLRFPQIMVMMIDDESESARDMMRDTWLVKRDNKLLLFL